MTHQDMSWTDRELCTALGVKDRHKEALQVLHRLIARFHDGKYFETEAVSDLHCSNTLIVRCSGPERSAIGVLDPDVCRASRTVSLLGFLQNSGIRVPAVLGVEGAGVYLLEDLGRRTLYQMLAEHPLPENPGFLTVKDVYAELTDMLCRLHAEVDVETLLATTPGLPRWSARQVMQEVDDFRRDLQCCAADIGTSLGLAEELAHFARNIHWDNCTGIMHGDIHGGNVPVKDGVPYLIDLEYLSIGPVIYDMAKLLSQIRVSLPHSTRKELKEQYRRSFLCRFQMPQAAFDDLFEKLTIFSLMKRLVFFRDRFHETKDPVYADRIPYVTEELCRVLDDSAAGFPFTLSCLRSLDAKFRLDGDSPVGRQ